MGKRLYVGNLAYSLDENALRQIFSASGQVESVRIITDRDSGRSKGFGFVEMSTDEEAENAIQTLNGSDQGGRKISVMEARAKPEGGGGHGGPPRRGGGGGGGYGGGGGGRSRGPRGGGGGYRHGN